MTAKPIATDRIVFRHRKKTVEVYLAPDGWWYTCQGEKAKGPHVSAGKAIEQSIGATETATKGGPPGRRKRQNPPKPRPKVAKKNDRKIDRRFLRL